MQAAIRKFNFCFKLLYISSSDNKELRYVDTIYILKCLFTTVVCRLIYLFEHVWNILREFKDGSIRIRQKFFSGLKYKKKVFPASRVGFFFVTRFSGNKGIILFGLKTSHKYICISWCKLVLIVPKICRRKMLSPSSK